MQRLSALRLCLRTPVRFRSLHVTTSLLDEDQPYYNRAGKLIDPRKPKRAKTAYMVFVGQQREEVVGENPDMNAQDILRELGRQWRELSDDDKVQYVEVAEEDKQRYASEMEDYTPPDMPKQKETKRRKQRDPLAPKRPSNAYMHFMKEMRPRVTDELGAASVTEVSKEVGRMWRELAEDDKAEYVLLAEDDKRRYEEEMAAYLGEEDDEDA